MTSACSVWEDRYRQAEVLPQAESNAKDLQPRLQLNQPQDARIACYVALVWQMIDCQQGLERARRRTLQMRSYSLHQMKPALSMQRH